MNKDEGALVTRHVQRRDNRGRRRSPSRGNREETYEYEAPFAGLILENLVEEGNYAPGVDAAFSTVKSTHFRHHQR